MQLLKNDVYVQRNQSYYYDKSNCFLNSMCNWIELLSVIIVVIIAFFILVVVNYDLLLLLLFFFSLKWTIFRSLVVREKKAIRLFRRSSRSRSRFRWLEKWLFNVNSVIMIWFWEWDFFRTSRSRFEKRFRFFDKVSRLIWLVNSIYSKLDKFFWVNLIFVFFFRIMMFFLFWEFVNLLFFFCTIDSSISNESIFKFSTMNVCKN